MPYAHQGLETLLRRAPWALSIIIIIAICEHVM